MKLQPNTGPADRIVRLVLGASLGAFTALGLFPGAAVPWVALAASAIFLTGATGFCPGYALLRLSSRPDAPQGTRGGGKGNDGLKKRS